MSKAFREAFPTLKLEEELEGLLDTTEVTKISANHEHTHIRIYLRAKRLIFKKNIWKLEKAITEQIFQNRAIQVKIIESYELSEQYTPKSLIEVYKDSILDELNAYSVLEYNLLRTADSWIFCRYPTRISGGTLPAFQTSALVLHNLYHFLKRLHDFLPFLQLSLFFLLFRQFSLFLPFPGIFLP